jgi:hypothetical protein
VLRPLPVRGEGATDLGPGRAAASTPALLEGRVGWNVNATSQGRGVAEMLEALESYNGSLTGSVLKRDLALVLAGSPVSPRPSPVCGVRQQVGGLSPSAAVVRQTHPLWSLPIEWTRVTARQEGVPVPPEQHRGP